VTAICPFSNERENAIFIAVCPFSVHFPPISYVHDKSSLARPGRQAGRLLTSTVCWLYAGNLATVCRHRPTVLQQFGVIPGDLAICPFAKMSQ
jgi:hypothetical protein